MIIWRAGRPSGWALPRILVEELTNYASQVPIAGFSGVCDSRGRRERKKEEEEERERRDDERIGKDEYYHGCWGCPA